MDLPTHCICGNMKINLSNSKDIIGLIVNPLITITTTVRDSIQKQSIQAPKNLNMPLRKIKKLIKHRHQISIKFLTCLVLTKLKLDNEQASCGRTTRRQFLQNLTMLCTRAHLSK